MKEPLECMCFCMFDMCASITKIEVVNIYQNKESGNVNVCCISRRSILLKDFERIEMQDCLFLFKERRMKE